MPALPYPAPSPRAGATPSLRSAAAALRTELIAALDHDLRTSLTTIFGALQTMARPGLAPADPDLSELLSAALAQAQRMRHLLDELPAACSPDDARPVHPAELPLLIREAAGTGPDGGGGISVELAAGLIPLRLSAPALRRTLAGILGRAGTGGADILLAVSPREGGAEIVITTRDEAGLTVPDLSARLVAAMGGRIETAEGADPREVRLLFPGVGGPVAG